MNDNIIVYKLKKGNEEFIGTANDIAKEFNAHKKSISCFFKRGKFHGYDITRIGVNKKVYLLYKNGELIKKGFLDDIANEIHVCPNWILQVVNKDIKMLKEYTVTTNSFEFVKVDNL